MRYLLQLAFVFVLAGLALLFALVGDSYGQERPSLKVKFAAGALITAAAIDGAQTVGCVRAGICVEANPMYRPIAGSYAGMALVKTGFVTGTLVTARAMRRSGHPKAAWAVTLSALGAQSFACIWNARQLAKVRR